MITVVSCVSVSDPAAVLATLFRVVQCASVKQAAAGLGLTSLLDALNSTLVRGAQYPFFLVLFTTSACRKNFGL